MPKIILKNIKGRHGKDGKDGKDGVSGKKGDTGLIGSQGPSGVHGEAGRAGLRGLQGEQGVQGQKGERGAQGLSGALGAQGPKGDTGESFTPEHEWEGESLRFKNPDGTWGKKRDLRGRGFVGGGPSSAGVKYVQITTATFSFVNADLVPGQNIFGVNYNGDVTITIPEELPPEKIIIIKDESGNAGSNNITIQT